MVYYDGTAMRQVRLPDGTFLDAVKHYQQTKYLELAVFPAWKNVSNETDA